MKGEIITTTLSNRNGHIGHILLNRPHALNALSLPMLEMLRTQLDAWRQDSKIIAVLIEGAGDRAFCAGGDIRVLYDLKDEPAAKKDIYFDHEYYLNELIFNYPKPYIALMDGIVMGGGVGISIWGSHPIATERLIFAMPETAIGLFPDIGASYFLTRLPHYIGWYMGLTGNSINAYEALQLKLIKTIIPHEQLTHFKKTLNPLNILLPKPRIPQTISELFCHQQDIQECFSQTTITEIICQLEQRDNWCQSVAATLKTRSPLSLKITLEYLNRSKDQSFTHVMMLNKKLIYHFLRHSEFYEGIRAAVIDKDKKPQWQHTIEAVDSLDISSFLT